MDVVIVSKTHMSSAACVGGVLANGRFVRLLNRQGYNQDTDTEFDVGDVYNIGFTDRLQIRAPHVEDILVHSMEYRHTFASTNDLASHLINDININVWSGSTDVLFDGSLLWTDSGSGYISQNGEMPQNSVGFWRPDRDLNRRDYKGKVRYAYPIRWRNLPFVGFQEPINIIPAGTLLRVSLARWWAPEEEGEERCYLQLSGWYGLSEDAEE